MGKNLNKGKGKEKKPDKNIIYIVIDNPYGRSLGVDIRDWGDAHGKAAFYRLSQWIHHMAGDGLAITDMYVRKQSQEVIVAVPVRDRDESKIQHMLGHHKWTNFINPNVVKNGVNGFYDLENQVSSVYICTLDRADDIIVREFKDQCDLATKAPNYHQFLPGRYPRPVISSDGLNVRPRSRFGKSLPVPPPPEARPEHVDNTIPPPAVKPEPIDTKPNIKLEPIKDDPWAQEEAVHALLLSNGVLRNQPRKEEDSRDVLPRVKSEDVKPNIDLGTVNDKEIDDLWDTEEARNALGVLQREEAAEAERLAARLIKQEHCGDDAVLNRPQKTKQEPTDQLPPDEPGIMRIFDDSDDESEQPPPSSVPPQTSRANLKRVKPEEDPEAINRTIKQEFAKYFADRLPSPQPKRLKSEY